MDSNNFSDIIADLSYIYENREEFADFVATWDVGVPAAYMLHNELMSSPTEGCVKWIMEAWEATQTEGIILEDA